jgi:molybdopterin molybdotransferase
MSISFIEAFEKISNITPHLLTQIIPIEEAFDRSIATNIKASYPLPRFDNSAMDGYAVHSDDQGKSFCVKSTIFAGDRPTELFENEIVKIMTGAPLPQGAHCVVPIEQTQIDPQGNVTLPLSIKEGQHIRRTGEDIALNDLLITQGKLLSWGDVAILASQGISHVTVYQKPRVTVFATGEELIPHNQTIEPHQIYNSNSPMLFAKSLQSGANASFLQASNDNLESIKNNIRNALKSDLIITTGGASVGDADLTKKALAEMGMEEIFTKIDIKPGKPTSLGKIGDTFVLILPGNPLACGVNFSLFGTTLISKLSGSATPFPFMVATKLTHDISNKGGMATVVLGILDHEGFTPLEKQGPNMVSPLSLANAMMILDPKTTSLEQNSNISVLSLTTRNSSSITPLLM